LQKFLTASVKSSIFEPSVPNPVVLSVVKWYENWHSYSSVGEDVQLCHGAMFHSGWYSQSSSPSCRRPETSSLIGILMLEYRFRSQSVDSKVLVLCMLIFRPFSLVILH
jgi:hypothetical protein